MKRWVMLVGFVVATGCGSGGDDDSNADTGGTTSGGSGVGGDNQGGDASVGLANGGAGAAAPGTGGAEPVPGMCSPVQRVDPPSVYCPNYDTSSAGIPLDAPGVTVTSFALPTTMVPGSDFAISLVTQAGEADVQLWGTNEECGANFEAFQSGGGSTLRVTPGVQCWDVLPTSPHSHVLVIRQEYDGYVAGEFVTCALGRC